MLLSAELLLFDKLGILSSLFPVLHLNDTLAALDALLLHAVAHIQICISSSAAAESGSSGSWLWPLRSQKQELTNGKSSTAYRLSIHPSTIHTLETLFSTPARPDRAQPT